MGKLKTETRSTSSLSKNIYQLNILTKKIDFDSQVYEKIKSMPLDSIKATFKKLRRSDKPVFDIF